MSISISPNVPGHHERTNRHFLSGDSFVCQCAKCGLYTVTRPLSLSLTHRLEDKQLAEISLSDTEIIGRHSRALTFFLWQIQTRFMRPTHSYFAKCDLFQPCNLNARKTKKAHEQ